MVKPLTGWAVVGPTGVIWWHTVRRLRRESILEYECCGRHNWFSRPAGYRCVKVEIRPHA